MNKQDNKLAGAVYILIVGGMILFGFYLMFFGGINTGITNDFYRR
ncbi:hypothetical protein [Pseudomonas tolaasii]